MRIIKSKVGIFGVILFSFILVSCEKELQVRSYKEKVVLPGKTSESIHENCDMKGEKMPKDCCKAPKIWKTPDGWVEKKGSGMRLATLLVKTKDSEAVCTIIPLKGDGGGLKPNLKRWLGQLKIEMNKEVELNEFISRQENFKTSGNLPATVIDFTTLASRSQQNSMLAAVVSLNDSTIFIKMTGETSLLIKNREKFFSLTRSFKIN